jgi:hypothetical protein
VDLFAGYLFVIHTVEAFYEIVLGLGGGEVAEPEHGELEGFF